MHLGSHPGDMDLDEGDLSPRSTEVIRLQGWRAGGDSEVSFADLAPSAPPAPSQAAAESPHAASRSTAAGATLAAAEGRVLAPEDRSSPTVSPRAVTSRAETSE